MSIFVEVMEKETQGMVPLVSAHEHHQFPDGRVAASPGPKNTKVHRFAAMVAAAFLPTSGVHGSRTWRFAPIREWVVGNAAPRRDLYFLVAGALGLIAALIGAIGAPRLEIGGNSAAIVNGAPIPREALARAVLALENDSRNPITPEREAAVLERLIEEEVLLQHGVELGLAETDFAARRALVQSVLALAAAERAGAEPGERELRRFYRSNAGFFAPPPRFAASVVFFRNGAPGARIEAARTALGQGADARTLGDPLTIPLPRAVLAESEWRRLIGADAASAAARLTPAQITQPVQTSGGLFLIRMDGFVAAPVPTFEDVAPQVRAEYRRRADEGSVRAYIDRLKRAARIERRLKRANS